MINPKDIEILSEEELKEQLGEEFLSEFKDNKGDDENE